MHISSYEKMELFVDKYLHAYKDKKLEILDVGSCDVNGSYKPLVSNKNWKYLGADIACGRNVDVILPDIYNWKILKSNSFDVVISGQAFEHIEFFWVTFLEMARVLKPGGLCCIIAPSGGFEHKFPVDCWRFYSDGFRALSKYAGFEILECFSENELKKYDDGSEIWRDSILIATKPRMSLRRLLLFNLKTHLSKLIFKL